MSLIAGIRHWCFGIVASRNHIADLPTLMDCPQHLCEPSALARKHCQRNPVAGHTANRRHAGQLPWWLSRRVVGCSWLGRQARSRKPLQSSSDARQCFRLYFLKRLADVSERWEAERHVHLRPDRSHANEYTEL